MSSRKIKNFDTVERFDVDFKYGLSKDQVDTRISQGLVNKSKVAVGKSYWEIIATNVFSLFNILLFVVAALMIYGGYYDSLFFLAVLIPNILIGLYEDIHARRLLAKLRLVTQSKITVIRDGKRIEIPINEVVLDDICEFSRDAQICVDGPVLNGSLAVNESFLTGESKNIYKAIGDEVFSGSYVTSGTAIVRAKKVGTMCFVDQIQSKANKFRRSPSVILSSLRKMFRYIAVIVLVMTSAMTLVTFFIGNLNSEADFIKFIGPLSGSLVSMIPSGLYLLTSVALATAVINLANKNARIQDFYSVEMLARTNVLCVDKTGTITDGNMRVRHILSLVETIKQEQIKQIISNLLIATKDDNITAKALKEYFNYDLTMGVVTSLPFNSENKYSAATFKTGKTYVLGACEYINIENKQVIQRKTQEYTSKGYRVLILAESKENITGTSINAICQPLAMVVLEDNIRPDAVNTFKWFADNDVSIKVISGDNALTVSEVAKQAGITNAERYVSLENMGVQDVKNIADKYTVFGRVNPEQKEALIMSLKEKGNTVGMTGDGVNDILALKRADCSIAMASGSDAAKNVSHIVLLDSNFDHLPQVVAEGRRVVNNLQRTCSLFLVKTIFATLTTLVFILVMLFTRNANTEYPFRTNHLYMWETLALGIPAFFLALQPNAEILEGSFLRNIFEKAIPAGLLITITSLIPFLLLILQNNGIFESGISNVDQAVGTAVISFTILSLLVLFTVCRPLDKYRLFVFAGSSLFVIAFFLYGLLTTINGYYGISLLKIRFDELNYLNYFLAVILAVLLGSIYYTATYIFKKIKKEKENENI